VSLDTKQKRGSVAGLTMPHRPWLSEPDGALNSTDRMSLLRMGAAVAPAPPGGFVPGLYYYLRLADHTGRPY
jgi:hypothetical protein